MPRPTAEQEDHAALQQVVVKRASSPKISNPMKSRCADAEAAAHMERDTGESLHAHSQEEANRVGEGRSAPLDAALPRPIVSSSSCTNGVSHAHGRGSLGKSSGGISGSFHDRTFLVVQDNVAGAPQVSSADLPTAADDTSSSGQPQGKSGDFSPVLSSPSGCSSMAVTTLGDAEASIAGLLHPRWVCQSKEDVRNHYMEMQRKPQTRDAHSFKRTLHDYMVSLYAWGWCCVPFRWDWPWLGELLPAVVSGFFIPFSMVPTAMTCAVLSGLPLASTLNSCWILCLTVALLGGAPGTVCTITEALTTALVATVREECNGDECVYKGREFVFPAGMLCGILQSLFGALGFGRLAALVPVGSKVGYVNAVAIINFRSQMHAFKYDPLTSTGYEWIVVLAMILEVWLIMHLWGMLAPWPLGKYVPASAVALGMTVFTEFVAVRGLLHMKTRTVGDVGALSQGSNMPAPFFLSPAFAPPTRELLSVKGIFTLIQVATTLMVLSSISTVMAVEKIQEKSRWTFRRDRQIVALGTANAISCFLGCLPGATAMMLSLLANRMGAEGKEGPILSAVFLCIFTSVAYHVLDVFPLGGLSGAIMYTAASAVSWKMFPPLIASFLPRSFCKKYRCLQQRTSKTEAAVVLATTILGATFDLGTALLIGIFISLCSFAWRTLQAASVHVQTDEATGIRYYFLNGPLVYATARRLSSLMQAETSPKRSVVVLHAATASPDHSVCVALESICQKHRDAGKEVAFYGSDLNGPLIALQAGRTLDADREAIFSRMQVPYPKKKGTAQPEQ
ncbi:uncharacterized protein LOC34621846 [Cyclospora cayetanensis]|nr:uncharacterized protein LOC34621846 [Cyclospora cayetanensis]